jgi:hypothetical protein
VYVTEVVPTEKLAPELMLFVIDGVEQLSVAVGADQVAVVVVAVAFGKVKLIFAGQLENTGANTSFVQALKGWIFTPNEHTDVLPAASLAV